MTGSDQVSTDVAIQIATAWRDAEVERLRDGLEEIRDKQGKVCETYEICDHRACQSSYAAWAIADKALRS